jgi:hypothetical protein
MYANGCLSKRTPTLTRNRIWRVAIITATDF